MTQDNLPAKSDNGHQPEAEKKSEQLLACITKERLPWHPYLTPTFGIERSQWRVIVESVFPNAQRVESIIMALSYCKARNLDIMKRPVHIVPVWDSKQSKMVEHIWPGIGELRTTAFRTGNCAGRDHTVFGPDIKGKVGNADMVYPEWAQVTYYRIIQGQRVAFHGPRVYWIESYAERGGKERDKSPNAMWTKRPRGQLEKCAEAAALRAAFPEEIGNEICAEEAHTVSVIERPAIEYSERKPSPDSLSVENPDGPPEETERDRLLQRIADADTEDAREDCKYAIEQARDEEKITADEEADLVNRLNARNAANDEIPY